MTKVEEVKLMSEGMAVLAEMKRRQKQGDNSFDDQIVSLGKELGEMINNFMRETA